MIVATEKTLHKIPNDDTSVVGFRLGYPVVYRSNDYPARLRWFLDLLKRKPKDPVPFTPLEHVT